MLCTLVAKYLCIYLFLTVRKKSTQQKGRQQNNIPQKVTTTSTPMKKAPVVHKPASHQYPVACSGKLLDVAFNRECTQLTQKPQSDSDVEVLQEVVAKKTSINGRSGKKTKAFLNAQIVPASMRMILIGYIVPNALLLSTKPVFF